MGSGSQVDRRFCGEPAEAASQAQTIAVALCRSLGMCGCRTPSVAGVCAAKKKSGSNPPLTIRCDCRVSPSAFAVRKSYYVLSMAQSVRVQVVLTPTVAKLLKEKAASEQRTVSNLAAYLIERSLRPTTV